MRTYGQNFLTHNLYAITEPGRIELHETPGTSEKFEIQISKFKVRNSKFEMQISEFKDRKVRNS